MLRFKPVWNDIRIVDGGVTLHLAKTTEEITLLNAETQDNLNGGIVSIETIKLDSGSMGTMEFLVKEDNSVLFIFTPWQSNYSFFSDIELTPQEKEWIDSLLYSYSKFMASVK